MPYRREQSNTRLQEAISSALRETLDLELGTVVTVLEAKIPPSEQFASVTLSVFPDSQGPRVLSQIAAQKADVDFAISERVRLRRMPRFQWRLDEVGAYVGEIDQVIQQLRDAGEL